MTPLGIELLTHNSPMLQHVNYTGPHGPALCKGERPVCRTHPGLKELHGISLANGAEQNYSALSYSNFVCLINDSCTGAWQLELFVTQHTPLSLLGC